VDGRTYLVDRAAGGEGWVYHDCREVRRCRLTLSNLC